MVPKPNALWLSSRNCLSIYLSVCLSVRMSLCLSVYLSSYLSTTLSQNQVLANLVFSSCLFQTAHPMGRMFRAYPILLPIGRRVSATKNSNQCASTWRPSSRPSPTPSLSPFRRGFSLGVRRTDMAAAPAGLLNFWPVDMLIVLGEMDMGI